MPDWPAQLSSDLSTTILSSLDPRISAVADYLQCGRFAATTSGTWAAASEAYAIPIQVSDPVTITKMAIYNGATVSGNVDVGIYDVNWKRLTSAYVSNGSVNVAQAGVSSVQVFDVADVLLTPGDYFWAMVLDNVTGTVFRNANAAPNTVRPLQYQRQASAYPLPDPFVPTTVSVSFFPVVVALGQGTIL